MLGNNKGQSTLEYITIFVAIVAAVIILAYASFRPAVENLYNGVSDRLSAAANTFQSSNLGTTP